MKLESVLSKTGKVASDIKSKIIRVNTTFASTVLSKLNNSNRPLSNGVAKLYANEMLRGQWKCNGEPLIFSIDEEGNEHLISGQHRLQGLLLANQAVQKGEEWPESQLEWDAVIIYGVQHDTADTVDTGKSRNHSDVLFREPWIDTVIPEEWNETIAKRKAWTKTLAGAARLVWLIQGGATVSSAPKFLISEMLHFIKEQHPRMAEFVTMVLNANDADADNHGLKMSLPYIAALTYVASAVEENGEVVLNDKAADMMDCFVNQLAVGSGFEKGDAAWALTGYWNKLTAEPGSKDRDRDWVGPFVKAAKAFIEGKTNMKVSDVSLNKKERDQYTDFPVMFEGFHTQSFERLAEAKATISSSETVQAEEDVQPEEVVKPVKKRAPKRKPQPAEAAV